MRFGGKLLALCVLCCALLAGHAQAQPAVSPEGGWGLPELMQSLAQVRSASARFTERQAMRMLNAPLVTSGTLTYVAPDYMQKITTAPVPERFVLDHGEVTISGGTDNQTHTFALANYPQIGGLVEGILATLGGDLPRLNRFYVVQLTGSPAAWQLLLQPKNAELAKFIKWTRIGGSQNRLNAVTTESSNGDYSEMSIVEDVNDAG
jgi:hypothetical protein